MIKFYRKPNIKMLISSYSKSHFISLLSAALVHVSIVTWAMSPTKPVVISKQAIQVSFVAPSSDNTKNAKISDKKFALNIKQKNALSQNKIKEEEQSLDKSEKNTVAGKQTAGIEDPNAVATNSAQSDPIFNATYLNNPAPYYPSYARTRGIQGKVLVNVLVSDDGNPKKVELSRSSGSSILDKAAIEAVKQWRFVAAKRGNKFVQANVIVPIEFKII